MHAGIIIVKVREIGAGAVYTTVKAQPRSANDLICWTSICGRNFGSKTNEVEIGLCRIDEQYIIKVAVPGNVRYSIDAQGQWYAPGDFVPYAEFNESDTGDELELYAFGYVVSPTTFRE